VFCSKGVRCLSEFSQHKFIFGIGGGRSFEQRGVIFSECMDNQSIEFVFNLLFLITWALNINLIFSMTYGLDLSSLAHLFLIWL